MGENSVDSIVTDPPYGLAFMGKKWDYDVPSVEIWKECLRVLKPGGHLLSFGGTRTYHRMVVAIEDAGFEIRDQIQWIYGSGFPKSLDVSKAMSKAGLSPGDKAVEGWGTALKPANEPIVLARKPLSEKTVAANVLKWGTGGINVDGCRVGNSKRTPGYQSAEKSEFNPTSYGMRGHTEVDTTQGRFPANLLLSEEAAEELDRQSGNRPSAGKYKESTLGKEMGDCNSMFGAGSNPDKNGRPTAYSGETGGASRFFYVAKASKRERNAGLEGMPERVRNITEGHGRGSLNTSKGDGTGIRENKPCANVHPTVKPIKLMKYLCRLITPPGGTVLDPFMGSGTTGVAALEEGFEFIGIEREAEYAEIAKRRIANG